MPKNKVHKQPIIIEKDLKLEGSLGGEISALGFGNLESAKEFIEENHPWNQEESEMLKEYIQKTNKNNSSSQNQQKQKVRSKHSR